MVKIKVQRRMSVAAMIITLVVLVTFVVIFGYVIFNGETVTVRAKGDFSEFWFILLIAVPLIFKEAFKKGQYVSDLILTPNYIQLIYKEKGKIVNVETVQLENIKSVNAILKLDTQRTSRSLIYHVNTVTTIVLKNGNEIIFSQKPSELDFSCSYGYFLELLRISASLPDFTYEIDTSEKPVIDDINYFIQYGKRMPLYKKKGGMVLIILYSLLIVSISTALVSLYQIQFEMKKTKLSPIETKYVRCIETAENFTEQKDYKTALFKLKEAQNIEDDDYQLYLKKARVYEKMKDYNNVIKEADKALVLIESGQKSLHNKANNFKYKKMMEKSGKVRANTFKGEAYYNLKNYSEAEKAFTNVIENVEYKYTDAYLYRGAARFYTGNKTGALLDFIEHKKRVSDYLSEMTGAKHPKYTQDDLILAEQWINACKN